MTPDDVSCLHIDRRERRRSEVAARTVDQIADANRVSKMNSHQPIGPHFLNRRLVSGAAQLDDTAAAVVSARHEQLVVRSPNRCAGVQAVLYWMRMTPQQVTVVGIDANDLAPHERDELILTVDVDDDRRSG